MIVLHDVHHPTWDDGGQQTDQSRDIAFRSPRLRREYWRNQISVVLGERSGWIRFQKRSKKLEHIGHEIFCMSAHCDS